jgi:hypothetical protein
MENTELTTITPETLLGLAVSSGQNVENLKGLMELYREWRADKASAAFYQALNLFQETVAPIKRTSAVDYPSKNGAVKFRFAALSEIITTIRPALAKAGLTVRWTSEEEGSKMRVTCCITHVDGHSECTSLEAEADLSGSKNPIQAKGSTLTYLQRYTVSMALGIVTEDDTDGNLPEPQKVEGKKTPTEKQLTEMKARLQAGGVTMEKIKEFFEISPEAEAKLVED